DHLRDAARRAVTLGAQRRPRVAARVGGGAVPRRCGRAGAARLRVCRPAVRREAARARRGTAARRRGTRRPAAQPARRRDALGLVARRARRGARPRRGPVGRPARRPARPGRGQERFEAERTAQARVVRGSHRSPPGASLLAVIVTVTLNAAVDRTLTVPNFQRGQRHRASAGLTLAGGKGINVARALKLLGVPVVATGFVGGSTGTRIVEELTREAVLNDFVPIDDESRTSTAVVDPAGGTYTEINEWGPSVSEEELGMLHEKLLYLTQGAEIVVFAGSLPRSIEDDFYGEATRELARRHVPAVLDTEGEP